MGSDKPLYFRAFTEPKFRRIQMPYFGKLKGYSFIWCDPIKMAPLNHKRAWGN